MTKYSVNTEFVAEMLHVCDSPTLTKLDRIKIEDIVLKYGTVRRAGRRRPIRITTKSGTKHFESVTAAALHYAVERAVLNDEAELLNRDKLYNEVNALRMSYAKQANRGDPNVQWA